MSTYTDFLRQHQSGRARVLRLYWVYGEEDVFRFLTVRQIKELVGAHRFNTLHLSAEETPETEVWASLNQHPLDSEQQRLLVVNDAHRLENLDRLEEWLKDNQRTRGRNVTAVFVSPEREWEHPMRGVVSKSSNAQYVRCALPKNESDRLKRAQEIICSWGNIDALSAGVLATHVNFDMAEAYALMRKAALFPGSKVTVSVIQKLAPRHVEEDIVWSLIALEKRAAAEAVSLAGTETVGRVLGALATHVETLGRLHGVLTVAKSPKEAARRIGAKEQYVRRLWPYARMYSRHETTRRTLLLTRLDAAWNRGAREGLLECLLALW